MTEDALICTRMEAVVVMGGKGFHWKNVKLIVPTTTCHPTAHQIKSNVCSFITLHERMEDGVTLLKLTVDL